MKKIIKLFFVLTLKTTFAQNITLNSINDSVAFDVIQAYGASKYNTETIIDSDKTYGLLYCQHRNRVETIDCKPYYSTYQTRIFQINSIEDIYIGARCHYYYIYVKKYSAITKITNFREFNKLKNSLNIKTAFPTCFLYLLLSEEFQRNTIVPNWADSLLNNQSLALISQKLDFVSVFNKYKYKKVENSASKKIVLYSRERWNCTYEVQFKLTRNGDIKAIRKRKVNLL